LRALRRQAYAFTPVSACGLRVLAQNLNAPMDVAQQSFRYWQLRSS